MNICFKREDYGKSLKFIQTFVQQNSTFIKNNHEWRKIIHGYSLLYFYNYSSFMLIKEFNIFIIIIHLFYLIYSFHIQ